MTVAVSKGRHGGWYLYRTTGCWRLCAGRVAITYLAMELDDLMVAFAAPPS